METLSTCRDHDIATVTLATPVLSRQALVELGETFDALAAKIPAPAAVLASAHPTIYLAGAHLSEISELDADSCVAYARIGRALADRIREHPAPVVAAVHGSCSGGGFDLVMACDAIVASPAATFSHPGVRRGLVTGWGGTRRLAGRLGPGVMRRVFLEGRALDAAAMAALGAVREIADDPAPAARSAARELASLHPSRLSAWRLLRGPGFVDRFRAFVVKKS